MGTVKIKTSASTVEDAFSLHRKLTGEELPKSKKHSKDFVKRKNEHTSSRSESSSHEEVEVFKDVIPDEKIERELRENVKTGNADAKFVLGEFLYQKERYQEAKEIFGKIKDNDPEAQYQLAVICYDGLGARPDYVCFIRLDPGVEYLRS